MNGCSASHGVWWTCRSAVTTSNASPASAPASASASQRPTSSPEHCCGPSAANDAYKDDRQDYVANEVATDYNAGFTSALAYLVDRYGGTALTNFPVAETPDGDEIFVEAQLNQAPGGTFTEVKAMIRNQSAFPARSLKNGKLRYWFRTDGFAASDVTLTANYSECGSQSGKGVSAGGDLAYVELSCAGQNIHPGGQSQHRRELQFRLTGPTGWDATDDPSFTGLTQTGLAKTKNITLYDGSTLIWGTEPTGTQVPDDTTPPSTPGLPVTSAVTSTSATLSWTASTDDTGVVGYDVYRVPSGGGAMTRVTHYQGMDDFKLSPDGSQLAVLHSSAYRLPQLAVQPAAGGTPRELTDTMKPAFTAHPWITPKIVQIPSSHGAGVIYAKYYGPAESDGTSRPAVRDRLRAWREHRTSEVLRDTDILGAEGR